MSENQVHYNVLYNPLNLKYFIFHNLYAPLRTL